MFHHFHDEIKHYIGPGSMDSDSFRTLLYQLKSNYHILSPEEWFNRSLDSKLQKNDVCLTFDDGLKCQFDIAYPVIEELNLKAYFFVNTFSFTGETDLVEVYRKFRATQFNSFEEFYQGFYQALLCYYNQINIQQFLDKLDIEDYLNNYPFYTKYDIYYRLIRDQFLSEKDFISIMDKMMSDKNISFAELSQDLWMDQNQILEIHQVGHTIGLHSHHHVTDMTMLNYDEQLMEYSKNKQLLESVIQSNIQSIAYPCGSTDHNTEKIMNLLNIKIGFKCKMRDSKNQLTIPRKDHAILIKELKQ